MYFLALLVPWIAFSTKPGLTATIKFFSFRQQYQLLLLPCCGKGTLGHQHFEQLSDCVNQVEVFMVFLICMLFLHLISTNFRHSCGSLGRCLKAGQFTILPAVGLLPRALSVGSPRWVRRIQYFWKPAFLSGFGCAVFCCVAPYIVRK